MNKTIKTIIICLLACFTMSSLFACVDNTPVGKTATAIAMKTTPKTEYYIGDAFDVTGGSITVTYSDATVEDKDLTLEMVTVPALTASKSSSISFEGAFVRSETTTMHILEKINAGNNS